MNTNLEIYQIFNRLVSSFEPWPPNKTSFVEVGGKQFAVAAFDYEYTKHGPVELKFTLVPTGKRRPSPDDGAMWTHLE